MSDQSSSLGPRARKIVVEAIIPAPVEVVWKRSQDPEQHTAWDIRFNHIGYLDETDERGYHRMDYRTNIVFGITIQGYGRYLTNAEHSHSSFEFDSGDWKSLIRNGRGIWLYRPCAEGTLFKTVYDYDVRYGWIGSVLDALIFRSLLQLATEWGFETLRQGCAGDEEPVARRRGRLSFVGFYLKRRFGLRPSAGAARSWLGTGQVAETVYEKRLFSDAAAAAASGRAT
jgi:hypothetical protein